MRQASWYALVSLHILALGVVEGLNPFWPIWLAQTLSPDSAQYTVCLAALYGLPVFGAAISATFWGRFADRYNPSLNWVRSLLGLGSSLICIAWIPSLFLMLLMRFTQGLMASVLPASQHLALQFDFNQGLFKLQSATAVASILGPLWIGWMLATISFTQTLMYMGTTIICAALLALCVFGIASKTKKMHTPATQTASSVLSSQSNSALFVTPRGWFLLLQFARWIIVPVLASLTLGLSQADIVIAFVYCALPLGMLAAKRCWQCCPTKAYALAVPICLFCTMVFTAMQLLSDDIMVIILLRFCIGVALAPVMPWVQREYLQQYLQAGSKDSNGEKLTGKGSLLGLIQRQQRLGMAAGLILGSMLANQPFIALSISALCYLCLSTFFIYRNFKGLKRYVSYSF
ncbi:MAG: MFS transporter [Gammaproteobacteria bacterium]|nr:MFS transporter [Gammaproteobacteria bacterium]MBQ0840363.1 MFS transporter [Gammaproteobacteria bacterium]